MLHSGLHLEVPCEKRSHIPGHISEMLLCDHYRADKVLEVAFEPGSVKLDKRLLILIKNKTICRSIDTKLMQRGTHLRREGEIGGGALLLTDDDSQFIDDFLFTYTLEKRTHKSVRNYPGRLGGQEFRNPRNAVADYVVQQFSRQSADPMSLVAKQRSRVPGSTELIAVITLHMYRPAAQEAALDESSHASRCMSELIVMPYSYLEPLFIRKSN